MLFMPEKFILLINQEGTLHWLYKLYYSLFQLPLPFMRMPHILATNYLLAADILFVGSLYPSNEASAAVAA